MGQYNIVTNPRIISEIKKSKYFKINLGYASTSEKKGERILSDKDQFAGSYNFQYKTFIYCQGNIGNITFYADHYITDDKIASYYNLEEFIFEYDNKFVKDKGIDSYLGHLLMEIDRMYSEIKHPENIEQVKSGNPDMIFKNPGAVSYSDIRDFLKNKKI